MKFICDECYRDNRPAGRFLTRALKLRQAVCGVCNQTKVCHIAWRPESTATQQEIDRACSAHAVGLVKQVFRKVRGKMLVEID